MPDCQAARYVLALFAPPSVRLVVRPFVCSFLRNFENGWTDFDANWHEWSAGQEHKTPNFEYHEVKGQKSRSYEAEDRFEGLAEASFSTSLDRVDFLVLRRSTLRLSAYVSEV